MAVEKALSGLRPLRLFFIKKEPITVPFNLDRKCVVNQMMFLLQETCNLLEDHFLYFSLMYFATSTYMLYAGASMVSKSEYHLPDFLNIETVYFVILYLLFDCNFYINLYGR